MAKPDNSGGVKTPIAPSMIQRAMDGLRYAFTGKPPTAAWFGPLAPLSPAVPEGDQRASVRGRMLDYPAGANLRSNPRPDEQVSFAQMRALADACDVLRLVIETRKDQMAAQSFNVVPIDEKKEPDARCKEVEDFFKLPDGENDYAAWQRMVLEDMFVLDAVAIYPWKRNDGSLYRLDLMDGSLIKRVVNEAGRTPLPPDPAYQLVLKGVPVDNYTSDELVYAVRNKRTHKLYGYSPVEQIIVTVNMALRRTMHQLQFYTEGSTPDLLMSTPPDWNLDQVRDFNDWWQSMLAGNTAARRKGLFVPHGLAPINTKEGVLKDGFDEWLARIVCYAFSVSPTPFIAQVNRATAESAADQALQEGLFPIMQWMKGLLDLVLWRHFGFTDLHVKWKEDEHIEPQVQAAIDDQRLKNGSVTLDEVRAKMALDPYPGGIGSKPMILLATGPVDLATALDANNRTAAAGADQAENPPEPPAPGLGPDGLPLPTEPTEPDDPNSPKGGPGGGKPKQKLEPTAKAARAGDIAKASTPAAPTRINRDRAHVKAMQRVLAKKVGKTLAAARAKAVASAVSAYGAAPKPASVAKSGDQPRDELGRFGSGGKAAGPKFEKTGGNLGSNPGGTYLRDGQKVYVKFPSAPGQVQAEQAADAVYELMGVRSMRHQAETVDGKEASVSTWLDVKPLGGKGWGKLTDEQVDQAARAYVASALTKNWDVVGLVYDNMGITKDGQLAIMDTGGSFQYRAQGGAKPFEKDATADLKNLLDPQFPAGRAFAPLAQARPEAFKAAAKAMMKLPEAKLRDALAPIESKHKGAADALLARRDSVSAFVDALGKGGLGKSDVGDPLQDALFAVDAVARRIAKAEPDPTAHDKEVIEAILKALDLSGLDAMSPDVQAALEQVLKDAGYLGLKQVGIDQADALDLVNEKAVEWAAERSAELVTQVSEATRDMLRSDVEDAMSEGWSNDRLAGVLAENYAFSDERALLIARTETAAADVQGNLMAYAASGVVTHKQWITGEGCCEKCDELDGTVVALDEQFEADGELIDGPPFHPRCRCDLLPIMGDGDEEGGDSDSEKAAGPGDLAKAYDPEQPRDDLGRFATVDDTAVGAGAKLKAWAGQVKTNSVPWRVPATPEARAALKQMKAATVLTGQMMKFAAEMNSEQQVLQDLKSAGLAYKFGKSEEKIVEELRSAFKAHQGATYNVNDKAFPVVDEAFRNSGVHMAVDAVSFRGLTLSAEAHEGLMTAIDKGLMPALEHFDSRYVCTSSRRAVGEAFSVRGSGSRYCLMHVLMPQDTPAFFPHGITGGYGAESELTLGRGAKMELFGHKTVTLQGGGKRTEFLGRYVGSAVEGYKTVSTRKKKMLLPDDIVKAHDGAVKPLAVSADGVPHGNHDAELPGDRPEAFDPKLSQAEFFERYGSMDDIAAITLGDGTQVHGKLLDGHEPAPGFAVDAKGFVVPAPKP